MRPAARAVDLMERLEQALQRSRRHADPRVAHFERHAGHSGRRCLRPDAQRDAAALGELDRVADEVQHHLLQALRVADDPVGNPLVELEVQAQSLGLGIGAEQRGDLRRHRVQRHRRGHEVELAGLDLRVIEHVVEDRHQRLAGRRGGLHQTPLVLLELRMAQQIERPEHPVHRGADLMTHRGEELRLGEVGGLGRLLGALQRRVGRIGLEAVQHGA